MSSEALEEIDSGAVRAIATAGPCLRPGCRRRGYLNGVLCVKHWDMLSPEQRARLNEQTHVASKAQRKLELMAQDYSLLADYDARARRK